MSNRRSNIYLVGFMGTGKTTIARELAKVMGRKFLDTDHVLERRFGRSVNEIFATEGEEVFRRAERELSRELAASHNKVVATGGGTVVDSENFRAFRDSGLLLRLYTREDNLIGRLQRTAKRPLLKGETPEEVAAKVKRLLAEREEIYGRVNLSLDTTDLTPLVAARKVHDFLKGRPELFYEWPDEPLELR